jgi:hypothetical protein
MAILDPIDRARNKYLARLPVTAGELISPREDTLELIVSGVIGAGG